MSNITADAAENIFKAVELSCNFIDDSARKYVAKEILKQFGMMGQAVNTNRAVNLAAAAKYIDDKSAISKIHNILVNTDANKLSNDSYSELNWWLIKLQDRLKD